METNNKKGLKTSTKILVAVVPVVLLLLLFLAINGKGKKNEDNNRVEFELAKQEKSVIGTKGELYDKLDRQKELEEIQQQNKERVNVDDLLNAQKDKDDELSFKERIERMKDSIMQANQKKDVKQVNRSQNTSKKASSKQTEKQVSSQTEAHNEQKVVVMKEEPKTSVHYTLGHFKANQENETQSQGNSDKYYEATLENSLAFRPPREFVFILREDAVINGVEFKKMSRLKGYVKNFTQNRYDVYVNSITNTKDGKDYSVELYGFNNNQQRGLYYEGKMDEAINNAVNSTVRNGARIFGRSEAVSELAEGAELEPEIPLSEGFKMYFKKL